MSTCDFNKAAGKFLESMDLWLIEIGKKSMTTTKKTIQDPDLARVEAALQRAAQKARKTARDTRTPLVIYKNGRIIMQPVEEEMLQESL